MKVSTWSIGSAGALSLTFNPAYREPFGPLLSEVRFAPYNDVLRQLAKEKNLPMADLFAMFAERIKAENKPNVKVLTSDGVHMNVEGNKLMATGVLKALGLNDAELAKAKAAWAPLEAQAEEFAKKQAEARAKAAAEKAKKKSEPKK